MTPLLTQNEDCGNEIVNHLDFKLSKRDMKKDNICIRIFT